MHRAGARANRGSYALTYVGVSHRYAYLHCYTHLLTHSNSNVYALTDAVSDADTKGNSHTEPYACA
ncbi:MAG: hypothetical protein Q8O76_14515 [Chloroflexota bacterium]|nr:hypothetical protein [Chloroflexota bacterium]